MNQKRFRAPKQELLKIAGYVVLIILAFLLPLAPVGSYFIHMCIMILIYIVATSSLRTINLSGQMSVGHAAFMGIGAYTSAVLSLRLGWTPWITMLIGILAATVIAILFGYIFTRLRAIYFAMVTMFLGLVVLAVIRTLSSVTGGTAGLIGFPTLDVIKIPGLFEINFASSKTPYYYFFLILTLFSLWILYKLEHSRIGMNWMAISQSHSAASSVGISEARFRIIAFAVGCFFAGVAGSTYAHYAGVLSPNTFGMLSSIYLVIYMLFGGVGSFIGPIIGTIILVAIPEIFRGFKEFAPFLFAGAMLIVVFLMPRGIVGLFELVKSRSYRIFDRKGGANQDDYN